MASKGITVSRPESELRLCRLRLLPTFMGYGFQTLCLPQPPHLIDHVCMGSPAAKAGVREGDVLVNVNGQDVSKWAYTALRDRIKSAVMDAVEIELTVAEQSAYEKLERNREQIDLAAKKKKDAATKSSKPVKSIAEVNHKTPKYESDHDIRLCTINRADSRDSLGFTVQYDDEYMVHVIELEYSGSHSQSSEYQIYRKPS